VGLVGLAGLVVVAAAVLGQDKDLEAPTGLWLH
jgi:hypothetical protein